MTPTAKTVLYVRVSTAEQESAHQITQAREAGFKFEDRHVIIDHGVSGVSTRLAERDQGKRLFDLLQPGDTLVVRWVNRLGRSYDDVQETLRAFLKQGVTVRTVINSMAFLPDHALTDPLQRAARDAVLAFMAGIAEAEETARREARRAGIDHAKAAADAAQRYRGKKPSYSRATYERVTEALSAPTPNISVIARETGLSRQTVLRIKADPAGAAEALARWEG